jgi:type VI secretion system protein ImpA
MSAIDLEQLLKEISPEAPSGKDLEYDGAFIELETDLQGAPAVEVEGQKVVQEAREPDWQKIRGSALDILARTHDLRVAITLTRALLRTDGLPGLRDGLEIIHGFIEQFWDTVYPLLDHEEDDDPTERMNVLESLSEWNLIIGPLLKVTLCGSRATGNVNLRQYRIAHGNADGLAVSEEEKGSAPSQATIVGIFKNSPLEQLQANYDAAIGCRNALDRLVTFLRQRVGAENTPSVEEITRILKEISTLLQNQLTARGALQPSDSDTGEETEEIAVEEKGSERRPETKVRKPDTVEDRQDVLRLLARICEYYGKFEPASPVPFLLKRAMGLVEKNFLEIIQDLAPESMSQVQILTGAVEEKQ